jgi:hypothetical protein
LIAASAPLWVKTSATAGIHQVASFRLGSAEIILKNKHGIFEESPCVLSDRIHEEIPQFYRLYFFIGKIFGMTAEGF